MPRMADLSDITAFLGHTAARAVYPNGTAAPSACGMDVKIFEGWPLADQLDLDMAGQIIVNGQAQDRPGGKVANVSIYPMQGTTATPPQVLDSGSFFTIVPAVHGLAASVAGNVLTLSGAPSPGEYLSVIADNKAISSHTGASAAAILDAIVAELAPDYPGAVAANGTLTLPTAAYLTARIGAPATMGRVTHKQRQAVMVSIWAPDPVTRSALAIAIDGLLKQQNLVAMPDTTKAVVVYNRTNQTDDHQNQTIYRRDLIFEAEYSTVHQFIGHEVTAVPLTVAAADTELQNYPSIAGAA
jgi:hypothetical protein